MADPAVIVPTTPIEAYQQGMGVDAILDAFMMSKRSLYRQLSQAGIPLRRPRRTTLVILGPDGPIRVPRTDDNTDTQTRQLRAAYYSGMLVTDIIKRFQVCANRLYQSIDMPDRYLRSRAVPPQGRNASG